MKPIDREQLGNLLTKYKLDKQKHRLLIIEDDDVIRQMMFTMLTKSGWQQVAVAENGRVGLQRVAEMQPDLILLDLMMPEMDGFEVINHLQENEHWHKIPVIVLTAKEITLEDRLKLNHAVKMVFQKGGYSKKELLTEIEELLDQHQLVNH
jgi:CheY-like chemotaxis protein